MAAGPPGKMLLAQALSIDDAQKAAGIWSQEGTGQAAGGGAMALDAAFKLDAKEGDIVEATFPFFGDHEAGQISFQIGDRIKVLQVDELWSWGKLERGGEEGWFPHNYVQSTYKPLPGMHELKQRLMIKRIREEARERGEDPDAAEAAFLNSQLPPQQEKAPAPEPEPEPAYDPNAYDNSQGMYGANGYGMGQEQQQQMPMPMMQQQPVYYNADLNGLDPYGTNNGSGGASSMYGNNNTNNNNNNNNNTNNNGEWSNINDVDMAFGMWMDYLHDDSEGLGPGLAPAEEPPTVKTSGDRDKRRALRKSAARELMETEDTYVRMLEALLSTVIRPTMGQAGVKSAPIPKEEANALFGTLRAEEILAINTAFRDQLKARMASLNDETCFGDLFTRFAPFLKMYVEYCTQHESTASRVSITAVKNDRFRNLLARARADPRCQGLDAQSLLIMPIQRIPRYKLLLEGMIKNTDADHPDYKQLEKAIEQISDVASFINDSIKRRENQAKIWGIQEMLSEPVDLAKPTRIFVKQGVLMKLGRYSDRQDFFALFNDGLLHARPATFGNKFIFRRLDPVLQVEDVGYLKGKPKALFPFRVVTAGHIFLVSAATGEEKAAWMRVLELTVRGGKRKLIHKGPLAVVHLAKDNTTVTEEYFYVFSDVVVRGKTLWSGKFKHKETLTIEHVEERFSHDLRYDAAGWEMAQGQHLERMFRLIHSGYKGHGSTLVIAPSLTEKAKWLSALDHQMDLRRRDDGKLKKIDARHAVVHQDNFAEDSDDDGFADGKAPKSSAAKSAAKSGSKSGKNASNNNGGGDRRASSSGTAAAPASRAGPKRGQSESNLRNPSTSNSLGKGLSNLGRGPLETVADDLLLALDDSDDDVIAAVPPAPSGPGGRGGGTLSRSSSQGSAGISSAGATAAGGAGKTHHLLDMDLARILGTNAPGGMHQMQLQQQQQYAGMQSQMGGMATAQGGMQRPGGGAQGGALYGGTQAQGNIYASGAVYQAAPVLPPPARDTPNFRQQLASPRIAQRRREYEQMLLSGGGGGQQQPPQPPQQQQAQMAQGSSYLTGGGSQTYVGVSQPQQQYPAYGQQQQLNQNQYASMAAAQQQMMAQQQQQQQPGMYVTRQMGQGQLQPQQQQQYPQQQQYATNSYRQY